MLDWIVDPPTDRLSLRDGLLWLVFPLVWTALTLVRGAVDGWYPYPFLDPANGGYGQVAVDRRSPIIDRIRGDRRRPIDRDRSDVAAGRSRIRPTQSRRRLAVGSAFESRAARLLPPRDEEATTAHGARQDEAEQDRSRGGPDSVAPCR